MNSIVELSFLLALENAEMNQVIELIAEESLVLMISMSCIDFEITDAGNVPGYKLN
jgi:hypothetical protein